MTERQFKTASAEETEAVGEMLARELLEKKLRHAVVTLDGEMGVGQTAFARGFGRALDISGVQRPP